MSEHGEGMAYRQSERRRVLVADDKKVWFDLLSYQIGLDKMRHLYEMIHVTTEEGCRNMLARKHVDFVVLDLTFERDGRAGFRLLRDIRSRYRDMPVVVYTASEHEERDQAQACVLGATAFVSKNGDGCVEKVVDIIYRMCPRLSPLKEWEVRLEDWFREEEPHTWLTTKQLSWVYCKVLKNRLNSDIKVGEVLDIHRGTVSEYLDSWKNELEKERRASDFTM